MARVKKSRRNDVLASLGVKDEPEDLNRFIEAFLLEPLFFEAPRTEFIGDYLNVENTDGVNYCNGKALVNDGVFDIEELHRTGFKLDL